jgi:hypothetical protein
MIGTIYSRIGRLSFGATFSDFSVLSGYIAVTLCFLSLIYTYEVKIKFLEIFCKYIIPVAILLIALILVGARTGIFAIAVGSSMSLLYSVLRKNIKKSILVMLIMALSFFAIHMLEIVSRPSLDTETFVDSTRLEIYKEWTTFIINGDVFNKFMGYALGSNNHEALTTIYRTPHNLLYESMLNGGIFLVIYILLLICYPIYKLRYNVLFINMIFTTLASTFVMPSSLQTRYFPVVITLSFLIAIGTRQDMRRLINI